MKIKYWKELKIQMRPCSSHVGEFSFFFLYLTVRYGSVCIRPLDVGEIRNEKSF